MKPVNIMAGVARKFSVLAANSRCVCIYHQPKMPKSIKNLKTEK